MGVSLHSSGSYRAYKKISGREYQEYFTKEIDAKNRQRKLDELASLKPLKLFRENGSIVGVSIRKDNRPERLGRTSLKIQINGQRKEITHKGTFEDIWKVTVNTWKRFRELESIDVISYRDEILKAKRFYMKHID